MAFLPDQRILVTERGGRLRIVERDGAVGPPLAGLPPVRLAGAGMDSRTSSTRRALVSNGSLLRSRTTASAILRAKRSSPYSRSTRAICCAE